MNQTAEQDRPPLIAPTRPATFIGAARYKNHSYGSNHPLGIPRVSLTVELIRTYGALGDEEYLIGRKATVAELEWFHTREYVAAMQRCEALGKVLDRYRKRHNIGNFENPYFPGFFTTPAIATGSSVQAAEQVLAGRTAFNPAGGMHHAMPEQARGFCYFNDPALGILRLRREGLRVLYLDIDAHHGDGVEYAFRDDPEVVTCSLHMDTEYAYPFQGGRLDDTGPHGNAVNLPLPQGLNDTEYRTVFEALWPRVLARARPDAVVLQAGTDMLLPDPLGKFSISTQLFLEVVARVLRDSPRLLVLGGGGYHPLTLARCWTGVWAILSGRDLPAAIPAAGEALLRAVDWDQDEDEDYFEALFASRLDPDRGGAVRDDVRARLERLLAHHPMLRGT
ncbi:acetoin utilization protein AcuC [Ectothiorhodospiraceae bacterium 2226]|nr:acetoin utilization protein AcuC [Ectothiorhodospiraceae bacterium 2226]